MRVQIATTKRQWHKLDCHFDQDIWEWVAYDYNGQAHYGDTGANAIWSALEANRVICEHYRHSPQDAVFEPVQSQTAIDADSAY